jgi:hypothetical protein
VSITAKYNNDAIRSCNSCGARRDAYENVRQELVTVTVNRADALDRPGHTTSSDLVLCPACLAEMNTAIFPFREDVTARDFHPNERG